jgi:hypothetical protein
MPAANAIRLKWSGSQHRQHGDSLFHKSPWPLLSASQKAAQPTVIAL